MQIESFDTWNLLSAPFFVKVHIFWEGHKKFAKYPPGTGTTTFLAFSEYMNFILLLFSAEIFWLVYQCLIIFEQNLWKSGLCGSVAHMQRGRPYTPSSNAWK